MSFLFVVFCSFWSAIKPPLHSFQWKLRFTKLRFNFVNHMLLWSYISGINPFSKDILLLYSLKTSDDVSRGYRSGTLVENGLTLGNLRNSCPINLENSQETTCDQTWLRNIVSLQPAGISLGILWNFWVLY